MEDLIASSGRLFNRGAIKPCEECGAELEGTRKRRWCSDECRDSWKEKNEGGAKFIRRPGDPVGVVTPKHLPKKAAPAFATKEKPGQVHMMLDHNKPGQCPRCGKHRTKKNVPIGGVILRWCMDCHAQ